MRLLSRPTARFLTLWATSTLVLLLAAYPSRSAAGYPPGWDEITFQELRDHVEYLASDKLAGRGTGENGARLAEEYIARNFERAGLVPMPGSDDYFVPVPLYTVDYDSRNTRFELKLEKQYTKGRIGVDFRPFDFSDDGEAESAVVFAGYGVTAPEYDYDDYEGLDVEGKFVLILRHEPGENDPESRFDGDRTTDHSLFTRKAENAQAHGAVGMILVTDPINHDGADDFRTGGRLLLDREEAEAIVASSIEARIADEERSEDAKFLAVHISRDLAEEMLGASKHSLLEIQERIDEKTRPVQVDLHGLRAKIHIRVGTEVKTVQARNVVGFLRGSDPVLEHEWIVVGGHHDHLGSFEGDGDTVYNGADDNASGTAAVIQLAKAFGSLELPPRRSILFVTFTAEERGLLGSRAMIERELVDLDRIRFLLNMDMIGRNPETPLRIVGDGFARGLREMVESSNEKLGVELDFAGTAYSGNTDHDSFYRKDVPFITFFSGFHDEYHQLGDHADALDYPRMESITKLGFGIASRVADREDNFLIIHELPWLGVRVEAEPNGDGLEAVVTSVEPRSRAAEGGIEPGDKVTSFGDVPLEDARLVGVRFREIEPGEEVDLGLRRGRKEFTVRIVRAHTGYMGIRPGEVDEDLRASLGLKHDEGITIDSIVSEGPCEEAGFQVGDVVLEIGGHRVGTGNLRSRLAQIGAGETVELLIVRDGERMTKPLTLAERPRRG